MGVVAGIDEAGRGPVLGPLVMAVVACKEGDKEFLNKIGVRDSKLLTPAKRVKLFRLIRTRCEHAIIKVSPIEIDAALRDPKSSLNELEALTSGKLIRRVTAKISVSKIILDLPSRSMESYIDAVRRKLSFPANAIPITAEYQADRNHIEVAAASILAKVTRDRTMRTLERRLGVLLGSGYPADETTIAGLHKHFALLCKHKVVRLEWRTTKELLEARRQRRLTNF